MSLPKIDQPIYSFKLPSNNKMLNFRPFLVKEEKILLMARESGEWIDILRAIKQIVNNCSLDQNFNINDITTTDLSYLFMQIRAVSVDSKVKQTYKDYEDDKDYDFEIDLSKVQIKQDKHIDNKIKVSKNIIVVMKYPTCLIYEDKTAYNAELLIDYSLIGKCIDKIYEGENIYDTKTSSTQEIIDFVDSLSVQALTSIMDYLNNAPKLEYVIEYKNSLGNNRRIVLTTLEDFFTF
jgi:hypothetical protein